MERVKEIITGKIRNFNRFYTRIIGAVNQSVLNSPFSMAEARVLFEIKHGENPTASEINTELDLDPGYLSRIIRRFEHEDLLEKERSPKDGRAYLLKLTKRGEDILSALEKTSNERASRLVEGLLPPDVEALLSSMETIEEVLSKSKVEPSVRKARPGELGLIAAQHMDFYGKAYGLDESFELYLLDGMAQYLRNRNRDKGEVWVAEHGGRIAGSIAIAHKDETTAQLRWFLVDPRFQGHGLGKKLMDEALEYCRMNLYHRVFLWTFSDLRAARHLYELYGFSPTEEASHEVWGRNLTEERWDMLLFDTEAEES